MDLKANKTLLALLLALYRLPQDLDPDDLEALEEVGDLLEHNPGNGSEVESEINGILQNNAEFKELYEAALAKLAPLDAEQLQGFLPSEDELVRQLEIQELPRGYFGGKPRLESQEITNLTRVVATSDRPSQTAKQLDFLRGCWKLPETPMF